MRRPTRPGAKPGTAARIVTSGGETDGPGPARPAPTPVAAPEQQLGRLRRCQRLLLDFSRMAAESGSAARLLRLAAVQAARAAGVSHTSVTRHRPDVGDLLVVAGSGWNPGVVGVTTFGADIGSAPGQALHTRQPVNIPDLPNEPDVRHSPVLRDHGVVSLLNVPVMAGGVVWGVLGVGSEAPRQFGPDDAEFLLAMSSILGLALDGLSRLQYATREAAEATAALAGQKTLFSELQHRNRNDLQLIQSLLMLQKRKQRTEEARRGLLHVMDRVAAIGMAQDQLSAGRNKGSVELSDYLRALCANLQQRREGVRIETELTRLEVPHERAVPLGLVVNELVTNALKHAFPEERPGTVRVSFHLTARGEGVLRVRDDGAGMGPPRPGSSGIELVRLLAQQIDGHLEQETPERGTAFCVCFPLLT